MISITITKCCECSRCRIYKEKGDLVSMRCRKKNKDIAKFINSTEITNYKIPNWCPKIPKEEIADPDWW